MHLQSCHIRCLYFAGKLANEVFVSQAQCRYCTVLDDVEIRFDKKNLPIYFVQAKIFRSGVDDVEDDRGQILLCADRRADFVFCSGEGILIKSGVDFMKL
jgi:hypothetical protein